jgi:hypothetical protein
MEQKELNSLLQSDQTVPIISRWDTTQLFEKSRELRIRKVNSNFIKARNNIMKGINQNCICSWGSRLDSCDVMC